MPAFQQRCFDAEKQLEMLQLEMLKISIEAKRFRFATLIRSSFRIVESGGKWSSTVDLKVGGAVWLVRVLNTIIRGLQVWQMV